MGASPMDAEDLGIEMDKQEAAQQGKSNEIDQAKVEADVAALKALAAAGKRAEAIDGLLAIEKQGRTAEDGPSTRLACTTILQVRCCWDLGAAGQQLLCRAGAGPGPGQPQPPLLLTTPLPPPNRPPPLPACQVLFDAGDWKGVQEHILLLAKRRSQLKQAVQGMVRQAMAFVKAAPDAATRGELLKTLQSLTEGKV